MRVLLKIFALVSLIGGALAILASAIFFIVGAPAFQQMMEGTTAIAMAQGNQELATSFAAAALGAAVFVPGVLAVFTGLMGFRATKTGKIDTVVFLCGVMAFTYLFAVLFNGQGADALGLVIILFYGCYAAVLRIYEAKAAHSVL